MTKSDAINELAAAMAKAQAVMTGAKKDAANPFFKSHYADLASVREACMPALTAHGLSVIQFPRLVSAEQGGMVVEVETILAHSSGQFIADTLSVPVTKADAQGVGSAITYARRYALGAVAGVAAEDDDGEGAVGRSGAHVMPQGTIKARLVEEPQRLTPTQPPPSQGYQPTVTHTTTAVEPRETTTGVKSTGGRVITEKQAKRLFAIIKSSGRDVEVVKAWIFAHYGVQHSKDIQTSDYTDICTMVEAPGPLPGATSGSDDDVTVYDDGPDRD
jgi:hypothetical protein